MLCLSKNLSRMELRSKEMAELCRNTNCKRYNKPLILMPGYDDDIIIYCPMCLSMKDKDEHNLTLVELRKVENETRKH